MRRLGALVVITSLLGGCLHDVVDPGLPMVGPEGPAATLLAQQPAADIAAAQLGWMIVYQANGHFAGYSEAEKVVASRSRAGGAVCKDDRDTRIKVTYPTGLWGLPVHVRAAPCAKGYIGWPRLEEFARFGRTDLVDAARKVGMTCATEGDASICQIEAGWTGPKSEGGKTMTRSARLTIDASGQIQTVMTGFAR
jgi:hypothetical protein